MIENESKKESLLVSRVFYIALQILFAITQTTFNVIVIWH
jgi:hypothetical protein